MLYIPHTTHHALVLLSSQNSSKDHIPQHGPNLGDLGKPLQELLILDLHLSTCWHRASDHSSL